MAYVDVRIRFFSASPMLPLGSSRSIWPQPDRRRAGKIANRLQNPDPDFCFIPCPISTFLRYYVSTINSPREKEGEGERDFKDAFNPTFSKNILCVFDASYCRTLIFNY